MLICTCASLLIAVEVRWLMSEAISLTEGDTVRLRAEVIGTYAIPVAIGVTAIPASGQPGMDTACLCHAHVLVCCIYTYVCV